jgi:hypothetical protein
MQRRIMIILPMAKFSVLNLLIPCIKKVFINEPAGKRITANKITFLAVLPLIISRISQIKKVLSKLEKILNISTVC